MLINEECGHPKVVADGRQVTANINQIKKPLCDKCYRRQYFFNKHLEYCESIR